MLNVVAIMGRLARDPELRQTTTGKSVASFRIACDRGTPRCQRPEPGGLDRRYRMGSPGRLFVCKYFQKGSLIVVDGRLQTRTYQDKNTGVIRTAVEVVANNINFAGPKSSGPASNGDAGYGPLTPHPPRRLGRTSPSYSA